MDYIYSYLNDDVASREMHGSETNTAVVTVNAATNTISVDVKPISPSMLNVAKPTESGSYILQETISALGEVSYSWATLEDYNQEVTQAIANLTQQLEQEKQERIESVQTEANVRELADAHLQSEIEQEAQEREKSVKEEAQRTNSMINQLNDNVQSGFNTINNVLTTSINNINNAILNESTISEEQFDDTTFRIRDLNTRLGVEIGNRESWDNIIYANLSAKIEKEKRERVEQDQDIRDSISAEANLRQEAFDELSNKISSEANRTDNMINQLNNNVQEGFNILNTVLIDSINTINGGIEEERQTRATADETLQSNIDAEANERKSVDQHLWNILPDNIIAGTPMQGMENRNAINIVFSKYQKHGIGEDPADAELVEVPDQAITLFPATQEVAGVLTAADKTKIDNIATDIETAVQVEANAREEADSGLDERITAIEATGVLGAHLEGKTSVNVQSEAGRTFNIDLIDSSDSNNEDKFAITLDNNDVIAGYSKDKSKSHKIAMVSKWGVVEIGATDAPLNLSTSANKVTVNDTYKLLDDRDKVEINSAISAETNRATQAETSINGRIDGVITNASHPLVNNVAVNITGGNTATLDYSTYNPGTGAIEENSSVAIPMATSTMAGFMSSNQVAQLNDSVKKTGQTEQIIQGSIAIQGNLTVSGTTTTNDTESLIVQDNLIVTNGGGANITNLSGLGIRANETTTFGVVYDPTDSELKAGFGTLSDSNEFTFSDSEGSPITLRDSDETLVNGHVLEWTSTGNKLIDSGIHATKIARIDQAQTFSGEQTFANVVATNTSTTLFTLNGVALQSNVAGNIAVESQLSSAITNLVNGANTGYQTLGEIEACIVSVDSDLQEFKTSTNSNITQIEVNINGINANTSAMSTSISSTQSCATGAYNQANSAYTQANTAYNRANEAYDLASDATTLANDANTNAKTANNAINSHIANKENPHNVNATQLGLGNVKNIDTTNATNITDGYLAIKLIASGLIENGDNVTVTRADSGVYTVSACVPVTSVANKTGAVTLNSITFTGACEATYNGESNVTVAIPNVPTLHSVSLSTNNGSATTVVGNVYSNSDTPIEIPIPESQTITLANTYNVKSGANGIVTGISLENGVLTVSYGALDDGTLDDGTL